MTVSPATAPIELAPEVDVVFATTGKERHFFGYYDKSPLDSTDSKLLCHRYTGDDRHLVTRDDHCEVGYFCLHSGQFTALMVTDAFNWQQGSMLQWLGPNHSDEVIWNDIEQGQYVARIMNIHSLETRTVQQTIYGVSPDGQWAVSPSFERHEYCRPGYRYRGVNNKAWESPRDCDDGVFRVDLVKGGAKLLISLAELKRLSPLASMDGTEHYVEHMLVNPAGNRFTFHHRWKLPDGGIYTRMYCCDSDGKNLQMLNDSGFYSHQTWKSDDEIVVTGRVPSRGGQLRYSSNRLRHFMRPLLRLARRLPAEMTAPIRSRLMPFGYLKFDLRNESCDVLEGGKWGDGHPSFHPSHPSWMLSDTYADQDGIQDLFLYNILTKERTTIAQFPSPIEYAAKGYRCDLHPRWDRSGNRVIVDTLCTGVRQVFVLDVHKLVAS
ncbi:hypothetical protein [Fuerstiella marisgermanici]|uniref:Dioxygenase n=1 Tax=Fuerstiella marisgermanici TaxID=1891926 RepID=A0A1P8WN20_9PLAN|nr:hypothetical protein [Fuerstiella marisgermanici]APZ95463.1 hypothetical protein Fuma_05121 [Fuerstiella marisgermanici]